MTLLQFKLQFPMDLDAHPALQALGVNPAPHHRPSCISLLGLT
jgi:hypothetical protein